MELDPSTRVSVETYRKRYAEVASKLGAQGPPQGGTTEQQRRALEAAACTGAKSPVAKRGNMALRTKVV